MKPVIALAAATLSVGALALGGAVPASSAPAQPLAGIVIALDPGHQLGNSNPAHFDELAVTHFNGHETKSCNTSGTATNAGYPEATFNWNVARLVKEAKAKAAPAAA